MADVKDYVKIAHKYREEVRKDKAGKRFCKWVRLACERDYQDHLRTKREKDWPYYFDEWWANDVCDFIEKLPHAEGQWDSPTITLEPWQIFILATIFGWRRKLGKKREPEKDPRRYRAAYIEVARKNGKSALSSGIALYCLCCEGENGPQIKTAATTGDQARIVFDVCCKMVEKTPDLQEAFGVQAMANSIPCWQNGGHIKPINSKASTQDGLNPHLSIIDELHAHDDRSLFDVLKSAQGARKNPLAWYITTAGYNTTGVCMEQRTLVTKILEGVFEGAHYFGIIFTLDEKDDPFDPKVWVKANPNYGVSASADKLQEEAEEAKNSPESEGEFKTKRCNIWLNAANTWLNMAQWDACKQDGLNIEEFNGQEAWIGCDLADKNDIAATKILFRDKDVFYHFSRFYLPKDLVDQCAQKHPEYKVWANKGYLTLTDGDFIDYNVIEKDIREWCEKFTVKAIAFDQYGSGQIASNLTESGLPAIIMYKNAKNFSDPAKILENRVQRGKMRHDGDPVMKWMASNAVVTRKVDGSILPKKETPNSINKIDGIDALIMAISQAVLASDEKESVYEMRGIISF
jgi:phage terminase large subunit-like protein